MTADSSPPPYKSVAGLPDETLVRDRFGDLFIVRAGQTIELVENGVINTASWGPFTVVASAPSETS